jgi:hypothetical protein
MTTSLSFPERWPLALCVVAALAAGGCSGSAPNLGVLGGSGAIGYSGGNIVAPNGYSESSLGPNQYRVRATGYAETSRADLEALATVRAADIGQSLNLGYFRVDAVNETINCGGKKLMGGKEQNEVRIQARRIVELDVTYGKDAPDTTWRSSRETFAAMRPQLDTASGTALAPETAKAEVAGKCGGA